MNNKKIHEKIPQGPYCTGCPFWKKDENKPSQENGYCDLLQKGDWDFAREGYLSFLWDQVKECDINI